MGAGGPTHWVQGAVGSGSCGLTQRSLVYPVGYGFLWCERGVILDRVSIERARGRLHTSAYESCICVDSRRYLNETCHGYDVASENVGWNAVGACVERGTDKMKSDI